MIDLGMIGLSHQTASLDVRERLVLDDAQSALVLEHLRTIDADVELVVLSTCNRTELYFASRQGNGLTIRHVQSAVAEICTTSLGEVQKVTVVRQKMEAVKHLLSVTCGLDSMVLGETQVLGQAKSAYRRAAEHGATGPMLHCLFQTAFKCAKQVHTTTGIGRGNMSVATAAVSFAKQIFDTFEDKTVLGLGTGQMGKLTLRHLHSLAPKRMWLTNRSGPRAVNLARSLNLQPPRGGPRTFDTLDDLIVEADIMVCATGARTAIITAEHMRTLIRKRRHRPLFILDIAVPRDVDPEVRALPDIYLYDLDDLQAHLKQTMQKRRDLLGDCERLVEEHTRAVAHQMQHADVGRMIRRLRQKLHALALVEQKRTVQKLSTDTDADTEQILEQHTHRLINKILHLPLTTLNTPPDNATARQYAEALEALFGLNGKEDPEEPGLLDVR